MFGSDIIQVNCWAHVNRNYDKKIDAHLSNYKATKEEKIVLKEAKGRLKGDIPRLQLCWSTELFDTASRLFVEHYESDPLCASFIRYFSDQYLAGNTMRNWYEGAAPNNPSHNNGNESGNRAYKRLFTLFACNSILRLLVVNRTDVLPFWSKMRDETNPNVEKYNFKSDIVDYDNLTWADAIIFSNSMPKVVKYKSDTYVWRKDEQPMNQ